MAPNWCSKMVPIFQLLTSTKHLHDYTVLKVHLIIQLVKFSIEILTNLHFL